MARKSGSASFLAGLAIGLLALAVAALAVGAQETRPNGAGLVVRHGDGSTIYAYVEFDGESISGEELLVRSGLPVTAAPFGGMGAGVCAINDEGCPADNCFCQSYGSPAYFWRYFGWTGESWSPLPHGMTSRMLRDGDIDGWSWSAGEHGLPSVSIDEIARLNGFERSPPATPTPPPPPPTDTATPTVPPAPTDTPVDSPTVPPVDAPTSTPEIGASQSTPTVAPAAMVTPTALVATPTPSPTATPPPPTAAQPPTATPTATDPGAGSGAVIVRPSATPVSLAAAGDDDDATAGRAGLLLFSGFALGIAATGVAVVLWRQRGAGQ